MIPLFFSLLLAANIAPPSPDAPAREPQVAVTGVGIALAFGSGDAIYFTSSADSGKTFAAPVKVAEAPVIPLNRHRGPRIAVTGREIVVSAVAGKTAASGPHAHGLPSDGDLIAWRSIDGGRSWSRGIAINDVPGSASEGLHSIAAGPGGRLFAVWLDRRGGSGTRLYGSLSADGARTWSKNVLIYQSPEGTICECCHPSVAMDPDGRILVMWRNWLAGSRDMYLARSSDGMTFSAPERLGTGTWKLNACPMDGGGLAVSSRGIMTVWRRDHDLFLDRPREKEVAIGEGRDVAIAAGPDGVYVIWSAPRGIEVLAPGRNQPVTVAPQGSFPSIVALPRGGALAAWEDAGRITVRRVP
jgi:hypothetical protein